MDSWTLRNARENDAPAIAKIWVESIRTLCAAHYTAEELAARCSGKTPETVRELIRHSAFFIVAESESGIFGFCTCSDFQIIRAALYVAPEAAGRGIGRSLLRAWEEAARKHGIRIMRIHSGRNATGFYRKCGYRLEKEITLSNGIRADEMTKEL